jgi:hypothetical protein
MRETAWKRQRGWIAGGLLLLCGCASLRDQPVVVPPPPAADLPPLPAKKQIRLGPFLFCTDADLTRDHPLLKELEALPDQICKELQLPAGNQVVQVYVFGDRARYDLFMHAHFRNLPSRRAFFMARTDDRRGEELVVYTYWGDRIQEDLRHELTHATLHNALKEVPMWLDEGLAEYFEVPAALQGLHYRHLAALRGEPGIPWAPDLARLEKITLVKDMSPAEYRESWAWVHLMLRGTPEGRAVLLKYLQQLRTTRTPEPLEPQLAAVLPDKEVALRRHLAQLEATTRSLPPP